MMHVAFHLKMPTDIPDDVSTEAVDTPDEIPDEISTKAIEAAHDFVQMCCQHAAHIAGRGDIANAILQLQTGKQVIGFTQ